MPLSEDLHYRLMRYVHFMNFVCLTAMSLINFQECLITAPSYFVDDSWLT